MSKAVNIWKAKPDPQDYAAASDFLSLIFSDREVKALVARLRRAPIVQREAKDILRASGCALLEKGNSKVAADLKKILKAKQISPVLLVRGDAPQAIPLIIADGYHRICASWYWEENAPVSCCLVSLR